jgi:hypothetical protein
MSAHIKGVQENNMDEDKRPERPAGNNSTHDPLPYLVRLRISLTDDAVPEIREFKVVGYSLMEATMQAFFEATGSSVIDDAKIKVEFVGPDEPAYWQKMLGNMLNRALRIDGIR